MAGERVCRNYSVSSISIDLLDDKYLSTKLTYMKDSAWLNLLGHFNTLYARITRAIINHTLIGKYYLRFFPINNY